MELKVTSLLCSGVYGDNCDPNYCKANKIECRLDLFAAWFWEYSRFADLPLHPHQTLLFVQLSQFLQKPGSDLTSYVMTLSALLSLSAKLSILFLTARCSRSQIEASRTRPLMN